MVSQDVRITNDIACARLWCRLLLSGPEVRLIGGDRLLLHCDICDSRSGACAVVSDARDTVCVGVDHLPHCISHRTREDSWLVHEPSNGFNAHVFSEHNSTKQRTLKSLMIVMGIFTATFMTSFVLLGFVKNPNSSLKLLVSFYWICFAALSAETRLHIQLYWGNVFVVNISCNAYIYVWRSAEYRKAFVKVNCGQCYSFLQAHSCSYGTRSSTTSKARNSQTPQ